MAMNLRNRSLAVATALVALGVASQPAAAGTGTGNAKAHIMKAITVTEQTQMNFASIFPPAGGGTVVLSLSNTVSGAGFFFQGTPASGVFTAVGDPSSPAVVTCCTSTGLTGPGGATMALGSFTNSSVAAGFDSSGNLSFTVGASLTVNPGQTAGDYIGQYTVTVDY